jgi:acetyl esterase/lipase
MFAVGQIHDYSVEKNLAYATVDGHELTMDIYMPETGKKKYPVLVIFHGGGWLINNKSIMDEMSVYMASHAEYVVCNVNYRLLVDNNNTVKINQIVEDALGAVLWVQDNIDRYNGDPDQVAVTGDSAGGHLAEMVLVAGDKLSSTGFDYEPLGFNPTYMPKGMSSEKLAKKGGVEVQAAIISYGAFDLYQAALNGFESSSNFFWQMGGAEARSIFGGDITPQDSPEMYQLVSPYYILPGAGNKILPPQLFTVGSLDNTTTPESVEAYYTRVKESGHPAEYWEYADRPHAFLDSGSNEFLGTSFEEDAPEALDVMIDFLNGVFYSEEGN